jgi:N-acetyl-1-D-myo-inositol-2-amino-2-deoxy-alpha-D-glucopyranoside deacetylase
LLAVHAHPDDEAFSMGGVLTRLAAEGVRTVLVCATRGEAGEIHDPDLDPEEARRRLGDIREEELRRACATLRVSDLRFLGYRDSGMVGTPDNADPRNFHNADPEEAAGRIVQVLREVRPQVVVTYNERGGYGHPDHIAAHRATVAAFDAAADPRRFPEQGLPPWQPLKLYYTAIPRSAIERMRAMARERGLPMPWDRADFDLTTITTPDEQITTRVDIRDYLGQKREALLMHRTQIGAEHPLLAIPAEVARDVMGNETFQRVRAHVAAPEREDDLFAGLR